jgi:hypothetical protein
MRYAASILTTRKDPIPARGATWNASNNQRCSRNLPGRRSLIASRRLPRFWMFCRQSCSTRPGKLEAEALRFEPAAVNSSARDRNGASVK